MEEEEEDEKRKKERNNRCKGRKKNQAVPTGSWTAGARDGRNRAESAEQRRDRDREIERETERVYGVA